MYHQTRKSSKDDIIMEQAQLPDSDRQTVEEKRRILLTLKNNGASYLSEISWEANLTDYACKNTLNLLWHEGLCEPIPVNFTSPDPRLMLRVPDQSAQGQGGYANFSRKKWFGITSAGREWLGGR